MFLNCCLLLADIICLYVGTIDLKFILHQLPSVFKLCVIIGSHCFCLCCGTCLLFAYGLLLVVKQNALRDNKLDLDLETVFVMPKHIPKPTAHFRSVKTLWASGRQL